MIDTYAAETKARELLAVAPIVSGHALRTVLREAVGEAKNNRSACERRVWRLEASLQEARDAHEAARKLVGEALAAQVAAQGDEDDAEGGA